MADIAKLAVGLPFILPFLNPWHQMPLTSFHTEAIAFACGMALILSNARYMAVTLGCPPVTLWIALFALVIVAQPITINPAIAGVSSFGAVYVLYAAALSWCGYSLAVRYGKREVLTVAATALLIGGMMNAAATIAQMNNVSTAASWFMPNLRTEGNPFGFLGQNNHFADYVMLAIVSALYLFSICKIRSAVFLLAVLPLLVSLSYSSSRSIWVYLILIAALTAFNKRHRILLPIVVSCALGIALLQHVLGGATSLIRLTDGTGAAGDDVRWTLSMKAIEAWREHPIFGVGFMQHVVSLNGRIGSHTHNIITQVMVDSGIVGLFALYFTARSWINGFKEQAFTPENWWIACLISVMALHSMVEFPLWYLHFLSIFALVLGFGSTGERR